jgi:methionyl-tRNA synthetase
VAKQTMDNGLPTTEAQQVIDNCLHICLQLCANLAIFINPFLPFTARKMMHMMKVVERMLEWENGGKLKLLSTGYSLRAPELLFRKIEDSEVKAQVEKLNSGLALSSEKASEKEIAGDKNTVIRDEPVENKTGESSNLKSEITIDDFAKIDLKVGTIVSAEKVEKADKLLNLQIDLGFEKRTILSGIAQHFSPEEIIGKQVVVVANLASRKMRGIESNGMILMAEDKEGKLYFIKPESVIANGSGVR